MYLRLLCGISSEGHHFFGWRRGMASDREGESNLSACSAIPDRAWPVTRIHSSGAGLA